MKKILLFIVVLLLPLSARCENTHLIITAKDGTQVAFSLQDKPLVTFVEPNLLIHSSKIDVSYSLQDMATFTYEKRDITSNVTNLQENGVAYLFKENYIYFPSLTEDTEISLYTITGAMIFSKKINQSGEYIFPLSHLVSTVYILRINNLTYKIIKR